MLHPKFSEDSGSSSLEFTLLVAIFVGPILSAAQSLNTLQLRQVYLDSIAQTVARDFSQHRDQFRLEQLADQLADDAGMERSLLSLQIDCLPNPSCSESLLNPTAQSDVLVSVSYRGVKASALQILDERGSVLPLLLSGFALIFLLVAAGVNIQAANLFDQRASSLARFLAHDAALNSATSLSQNDLTLAKQTSNRLSFNQSVESASLESADLKTFTARVCLRFSSTLDFFGLPVSRACATASMRKTNF